MPTRLLLTMILALAAASAVALAARPVEPLRGCATRAAPAPVLMAPQVAPAEPMASALRARHCRAAAP